MPRQYMFGSDPEFLIAKLTNRRVVDYLAAGSRYGRGPRYFRMMTKLQISVPMVRTSPLRYAQAPIQHLNNFIVVIITASSENLKRGS
jgi:hypothetical protein